MSKLYYCGKWVFATALACSIVIAYTSCSCDEDDETTGATTGTRDTGYTGGGEDTNGGTGENDANEGEGETDANGGQDGSNPADNGGTDNGNEGEGEDGGGNEGEGEDGGEGEDVVVPDTPGEMCEDIPTSLDFGKVPVGSSSSRSITIENCGGKTLEITDTELDPIMGEFSKNSSYDNRLAYQEKTTLTLTYTPVDVGVDAATFKVSTNDAKRPETTVALTGEGIQSCSVRCVPTSYDFGTVEIGFSNKMKVMCENRGTTTAEISSIALQQGSESNYILTTAQSTPILLAQFKATSFYVEFKPQRYGQIDATAEVVVKTCQGATLGVALTGFGGEDVIPKCFAEKSFNPRTKWEWNAAAGNDLPKYDSVFMTPVVAPLYDTNSDGVINENDTPCVVFSTYSMSTFTDGQRAPAAVRILEGKTGQLVRTFSSAGDEVLYSGEISIGDINNDGVPEIIATKYLELPGCECPKDFMPFDPMRTCCKHEYGYLMAWDPNGTKLWESEKWNGDVRDIENYSAPFITDLNADGTPEILYGSTVLSNEGKVIWEGKYGHGSGHRGYQSLAADIDGDGKLEVIAGNTAYRYDGTLYWQAQVRDGLTAIADLDLDGKPEIVLNSGNGINYLKYDGTIIQKEIPKNYTQGGCCQTPPAIGDLDGDGYPEVVVANYAMPGSTDDNPMHVLLTLRADGSIFWQQPITDMTGAAYATIFDFEGDGKAEIVYADESTVYIIRGEDGEILYQADRYSKTGGDAPVVVDVDNNKHAELILPIDGGGMSIRAYFTEPEMWMNTRKVWNQVGYSITNINDDLSIPKVPMDSWKLYNTFRANSVVCKPNQ